MGLTLTACDAQTLPIPRGVDVSLRGAEKIPLVAVEIFEDRDVAVGLGPWRGEELDPGGASCAGTWRKKSSTRKNRPTRPANCRPINATLALRRAPERARCHCPRPEAGRPPIVWVDRPRRVRVSPPRATHPSDLDEELNRFVVVLHDDANEFQTHALRLLARSTTALIRGSLSWHHDVRLGDGPWSTGRSLQSTPSANATSIPCSSIGRSATVPSWPSRPASERPIAGSGGTHPGRSEPGRFDLRPSGRPSFND